MAVFINLKKEKPTRSLVYFVKNTGKKQILTLHQILQIPVNEQGEVFWLDESKDRDIIPMHIDQVMTIDQFAQMDYNIVAQSLNELKKLTK